MWKTHLITWWIHRWIHQDRPAAGKRCVCCVCTNGIIWKAKDEKHLFFPPHKEKRYGWVKNSHMHTKETRSIKCEKLKGKCSFAAAAGEPGVKYRWAALTLASHINNNKDSGKYISYSICLNTSVEVVYFVFAWLDLILETFWNSRLSISIIKLETQSADFNVLMMWFPS